MKLIKFAIQLYGKQADQVTPEDFVSRHERTIVLSQFEHNFSL